MRGAVLGPDVLEEQVLGDDLAGVEGLEHREHVGVLLQLQRQRGARVRAARRTGSGSPHPRPAARRGRAAGSGRCPSRRGRAAARRRRPRVRSTGARRGTTRGARPCRRPAGSGRPRPWTWRPTSEANCLRRVDVVRQPGAVVEELRQPAEPAGMGRGVRRAHARRSGAGRDRVGEQQPLAVGARRRSGPRRVGPDAVVGLGRRASQRSQMAPRSPTSYASSGSPSRRPGGRKSRATKAGSSRSTPPCVARGAARPGPQRSQPVTLALQPAERDALDEPALEDR